MCFSCALNVMQSTAQHMLQWWCTAVRWEACVDNLSTVYSEVQRDEFLCSDWRKDSPKEKHCDIVVVTFLRWFFKWWTIFWVPCFCVIWVCYWPPCLLWWNPLWSWYLRNISPFLIWKQPSTWGNDRCWILSDFKGGTVASKGQPRLSVRVRRLLGWKGKLLSSPGMHTNLKLGFIWHVIHLHLQL